MSASFNSEELKLFAEILNRTCTEMNVRDDATRSLIALRIMHLAEEGERDPDKLRDYARSFIGARCSMADAYGTSMSS